MNYGVVNHEKRCVICRQLFTEENNTGAWLCLQHPKNVEDGKFQCCGLKTGYANAEEFYASVPFSRRSGCEKCDHRTSYEPFTESNGGLLRNVEIRHGAFLTGTKAAMKLSEINGRKVLDIYRFQKNINSIKIIK
jgi:hypothetical protein